MATIRKRGDFQWQAAVRRQGHSPILKTFRFKRDAESWARETESELERGTWIDRTEIERTTLQDAMARYLKEGFIRQLDPSVSSMPPKHFGGACVNEFIIPWIWHSKLLPISEHKIRI